MKIIAYDFECYKYDFMMVVIDYDTKERTVIVNDEEALESFYEKNKESIWVGFNNRQFDQYLMKGILLGMNPYDITVRLITENEKGYKVVPSASMIQMYNFDVSTGFHSLKQIESFMGSKIQETSVPFDVKRKLTPSEIQETIDYCTHDVEETINIFDATKKDFDSQVSLIQEFELPMEMFNKTKAQLAAVILGAKKTANREDDFQLTFPPELIIEEKYKYIFDWYKNPVNMNYEKSLVTRVADVEHVFAWGGIHGAVSNFIYEGVILCLDANALYPYIMINWDFLSRNVQDKEKYRQIRDTRFVLQAKKDPKESTYKLVSNIVFGASKDEHNALYDPLMSNNTCVAGQLLLLDLIGKIEPYGKIINSNTDGLFLQLEDESQIEKIKAVAKEWEIRTNLVLKWDLFSKIYQKDVNNYIIIDKDGKYKSKGAYVKKLSKIDYDLPIVNHSLIEYFVHNTPVEETILACDDLIEFQKTVKITSLYKYALHGNVQLKEKVLRVFASTNPDAPGVFKVKSEDKADKIANTPEHCFINNENIIGVKVPPELDKQYYIDVAKKRIDDFISPKNKKPSSISSGIKFVNFNSKEKLQEIYDEIEFDTFIDFMVYVAENTHVDKRSIETLIKLNYFKNYGTNMKLFTVYGQFRERYKKTHKEETKAKRINELYTIESNVKDEQLGFTEQLAFETEVLGSPVCTFNVPKGTGYVIDVQNADLKYAPKIEMYGLNNGNTTECKMDKKVFRKNPVKVGEVIQITKWLKKPRVAYKDGSYEIIEGKFDFWINEFRKIPLDRLANCMI